MPQDILNLQPLPADYRLPYGTDPNQFADLRLPHDKKQAPVVMNIHGGYWRARYDLVHAGHFCAVLTAKGCATWNIEYRRVGNAGGGWPGTMEDVANAFRFLAQIAPRYSLDATRVLVMGHSAGAQLAISLAAHEPSVQRVMSLAGVTDLQRAYDLHLSNDAVVEFLGGKPNEVPDHYQDADPIRLHVPRAQQVVIHGLSDNVVPFEFSHDYAAKKKKAHEQVELLEITNCDHFDLIDPRSKVWPQVEAKVVNLLST